MPEYFVYPIYTAAIALAVIAVVPKEEIRRLGVYAITFGGFASVVVLLIFGGLFNIVEWRNFAPFGFGSIAFFPPIAWTNYFIMFFYFLPERKPWLYLFVLFAAAYSTLFSNVLMNLEILAWYQGRVLLPFFIYISWFSIITWAYLKSNSPDKDRDKRKQH